jgi:polar amino acid transport system substrate-binding protein
MPVVPGDLKQSLAPTGVLRASINLGNPVLAQGSGDDPCGVTVELAQSVADELDVPISFVCFDAARSSFEAVTGGDADIAFLAIEPARSEQVAFTAPYVIIDGVFVVPVDSTVTSVADVDRLGVSIGVKRGSAYDLYLTRTLEHADLVRGDEGVDVYLDHALPVGAGIRQPVEVFAAGHPGHRVIAERFMQIQQAVAVRRSVLPEAVAFVADVVERRKADGSVAAWLQQSGQADAAVAPAR